MSGKVLIVGDCLSSALESQGALHGYHALVSNTLEDAAEQIRTNRDIVLIIICRYQEGTDCYDLARQLDRSIDQPGIPMLIIDNQDGLLQALAGAHPHHAALLQAILTQSSLGIALGFGDPGKSNALYPIINDAYIKIAGRSREELINLGWDQIVHPEDVALDEEERRLLGEGKISGYSVEKRILRPDGSQIWVELTVAPFEQPGGGGRTRICLIKDISDRKAIEERLSESERSKAVLLQNLPGLAYRCLLDRFWTMQFVSEGCEPLTGYPAESLLYNRDLSFNDLIAPEYREVLWKKWQEVLSEQRHFEFEYEIITASGQRKWVLEMGQGVFNEQGQVDALEGIIIDITERKESELQLRRISEIDLLTGLPNRRALQAVMAGDSKSGRYPKRSVIVFNLRRLNTINSVYGFSFCESLLASLAERLSALCTPTRSLYTAAYGRFAFYIQEPLGKEELLEFCSSVVETLKSAALVNTYGCGIGIRQIEGEDHDPETLIHNAGISAERADDSRPFAYRFFDQELAAELDRLSEIEELLLSVVHGAKEDALYLQYQPIIHSASHKVCGFEALARLDGGPLGTISPGEFIPIAEENQLIVPLGKLIAKKAFTFLRRLEKSGLQGYTMSINVSAIQLAQEDFVPELFRIIGETGVDPTRLCVEITESVFAQNYAAINKKFTALRQAGITIAIDDFGTGYSSLAREQELDVDRLKIHKTFIDRVGAREEDQVIAGDIISIAHRLGHTVVAEGVEQEIQKAYLVKHQCDFLQGYLFSGPVGEAEAIALLEQAAR
jgi:PAS domain S-box-containing protein